MRWLKQFYNRLQWMLHGSKFKYTEAVIYNCRFCSKKYHSGIFNDICPKCVHRAVVKILEEK